MSEEIDLKFGNNMVKSRLWLVINNFVKSILWRKNEFVQDLPNLGVFMRL